MNKTEANIIKIIKCAFGSAVSLTDSEIDWDKVFDLGKKHSIIPILYYGLCNLKIDSSNEIYKKMGGFGSMCGTVSGQEASEKCYINYISFL